MGYADEIFDLAGKVVVVTGGSRGLGKEIATAVARQGADVVIASRKLENCEQVADEIKKQTGRQAMPSSRRASTPSTTGSGRSTCSSTTRACHRSTTS